MIFSEESSRVIYEMGNMELFELGQISVTIRCHSCLKHVPEGFFKKKVDVAFLSPTR